MAKELAHFKNFAKLKDTTVEFNDITVLAGKPGTGKSYVMKYFYALFESLSKESKGETLNKEEHQALFWFVEELYHNHKNIPFIDYTDYKGVLRFFKSYQGSLYNRKNAIKFLEELEADINARIKNYLNNLIKSIFTKHNQISESYKINYKNFEINYENSQLNVMVGDLFDKIDEIVFVETPLILEFKKFMNHEKGKTPYHIESLLNILDTDYSFTDKEQDEFIKGFREKSKNIISGDIESSGDSFIFNRIDDKNYDILNASSGIKSIGLLQYLVTNKALKKGSILFWEEPEVHLHPSWQLKMVDLFVELMNAGVKIVFSTHSPFMADYLNAISQKNGYRERISFNVLDEKDGVVENHILDEDSWHILQSELMDSFEDILWQYL